MTQAQDTLVKDLSRIEPCNPRLLNKMYALSNVGLQERWLGKFANTRSIQQIAFKQWSSEYSVYLSIMSLETRFAMYLQKKKPSDLQGLIQSTCVTVYTQVLREQYWNIRLEGITMPPQQEQTRLINWQSLQEGQANRAILVVEQTETNLHKATSRGKYTPYFGSVTKLRALRATLQVVEVGSLISSIKQLMELRSWVRGDPVLMNFLEAFITEKTTIPIQDLSRYTRRVYSGSLSHRLPCPAFRRGGLFNQNLNHSSFYTITSDTALDFARGGINYTICFQSCYLHALVLLAHRTELNVASDAKMALHFTCSQCTWILPPETFSLEAYHYPGVNLVTKVQELHHKDIYEIPIPRELGCCVILLRHYSKEVCRVDCKQKNG